MGEMAREVWRTEVMETKTHPTLQLLCYQTKNLYNRAMFLFKQHYTNTKKWLSYQQLDRILKLEQCYRILPAQTAQQTLKLLVRNWRNFKQATQTFQKKPQIFLGKPRPPKYKSRSGQQIAIFTNQQAKIKDKKLILPKKVAFSIKTRLTDSIKLREVRIIPRGVGYSIEIVYSKHVPELEINKERIGAIDLGIHNLITYVDNIGSRPIVVKDEGKGIKSIIRYYLKEVKKLQQKYVQQQQTALKKSNKLSYGKKFLKLRETKRRKVNNWIHQMSSKFVKHWIRTGIQQVFIGYNPQWKQQIRLRKKTTQMFVIVPFDKFISSLKYKAEEHGIIVERIEESYTSKCSFLDNEYPQKQAAYKGKRTTRGLFKSSTGSLINSDVNGAYNILLKGDPQAFPHRNTGGVGGYVIYPIRWSFEHNQI
jgi:IS605 OrfB family transposase